ncbi:hypothetical protein ABPG74_016158 [Tetrahymena malaccensis]
MIHFQVIVILGYFIFFVTTQELFQSQQTIFQALPKQVITINQNQQVVPTQMLVVEDSQLIIFINQENYIALFDEIKNKMRTVSTSEQVQSIAIFDNQQYLIAGMITFASVYEIQQDNNNEFILVQKQTFSIDLKIFFMLYLSISDKILILSSDGIILIYQNQGGGHVSQKNKLFYDDFSFVFAQVSQDERFLFASLSLKDIAIFQIEKNVNIDGSIEISNIAYLISIDCDYWIVQLVLLKNFIYYIDPWQGLYFADLSPLYQNNTQAIKSIKPVNFGLGNMNLSPTTYCLTVSSDQKYLYLGVRSQGILIYDISNITNPILYYQLFVQGQAYYLLISNKGQSLYYSNSNGLYQYQQTRLSFINYTPNLYNSHKSKSLFDGLPIYKWRCQISQNSNVLYAALDVDMIQRFQIIENSQVKGDISLQKIDTLPYAKDIITSTPYIETICIDKDEDYLYIPVTDQNNIIIKYQIPSSSNLSAPLQYIQSLQYQNVQFSEQLNISQDKKYLVLAYTVGVMIVDIEQFKVLSLLNIEDMQNNCYGAEFTRDTNYIFATARNMGVWIIDSRDKQNPFVIQVLKTKAAETVTSSKLYDIMYCLDGFNGLLIFDTSTLPNIKILGTIKLQGWANDITLLQDEKFAIISTMDLGMLSLINLADKANPIIISYYQIGQQNSYSTCVDPSMQYVFILNSQSIRYFPLVSNIHIHYEFSIKQISQNSKVRVVLNQDDALLVGQTYELRLIPLYQKQNQSINNIFIFQNGQKQALPIWINLINNLYLEMAIPKEAVIFSDNQIITLLLQTQFSLKNFSFIYDSSLFVITPNLSDRIYQYLKICGFINSYDLVTDLYNPEVEFNFKDFGNDITDPKQQILALKMVRNILQNSIDYNPIQFKVQSSLNYILNQKNNSFQVHSISNSISIQLSFSSTSSLIFVQKEYPNVISYRDDQNTTLNLQSSVDSINNILRENILYHIIESKNNQNKQFEINLLIQDNINSNIQAQFNVSDLSFLKLKQNVKQLKELQPQIEKISSDSSFAIESTFIIQFDHNSFIDPDGIPLFYQLQIYQNNIYQNILPEYFIKFDEQNLRITGTPQAANLFETIRLRLVVSNGYNQLNTQFYIEINNISLTYLLNLLLKYVGPAAFILGIYRYKSYFINRIFKNKTFYSQEFAQINKVYRKKITLIENELIVAQAFLKKFSSKSILKRKTIKLEKDYFGNQIDFASFAQIDQENLSYRPAFSSSIAFFPSQVQQNSTQIGIKHQNFTSQSICQVSDILKSQNSSQIKHISINKSIKKAKKFKKIKRNTSQKMQTYYFKNLNLPLQINNLIVDKENKKLCENEKKRAQIVKKSLQESNRNNLLDQDLVFKLCYSHPQVVNNLLSQTDLSHNLEYYNQNKLLNIKISADKLFSKMIQNDLKIQYQGNNLRITDYTIEYYNSHSRFNYCLNARVVDYLLKLDTRTNIVYSYLKEYSKRKMNYTENDWYKAFVQIEPTNEVDCNGIIIPFSNINVNESSIVNCLSHLDLYSNIDQPFDEIWQHGISPVLLKQALIFESLGLLNSYSNKRIVNKSKGESIFIQQHQIFSVEAFQLKKQTKLNFFHKMLHLEEYERLPISKYQYLPSWIQLDCKSGLIILEGIPTCSDYEEILIRIYNVKNYIMMQYNLKIIHGQSQGQIIQQDFSQFKAQCKTEVTRETPIKQAKNSLLTNLSDYFFLNNKKNKSIFNQNCQKEQIFLLQKSKNADNLLSQRDSICTKPVTNQIQKSINQPQQDAYYLVNQFKRLYQQQSTPNPTTEIKKQIQFTNQSLQKTKKQHKSQNKSKSKLLTRRHQAQELLKSQQTIFQAQPKQIITIQDNQSVVPSQMLIVEDSQLIIFISQENYLGLFDEVKNEIKVLRTSEQVQTITLFDNQQYLIAGMLTFASIYQIQHDNNNHYFLAQKQTFNVDFKILCILYLSISKNIFIISPQKIIANYKYLGDGYVSQKNNFFFQGFNFLTSSITQDEIFMFACLQVKNIAIFKIEKQVNIDGTLEISNLAYLFSIHCDYWIAQVIFLQKFIYYIDTWQGLYFADLSPLYQNNTQTVNNIKPVKFGLGNVNLSPTTQCMTISSDQQYLYLGIRSYGILIYDISNVSNPTFCYQLFVQGQAYYLLISNKGQYLYYSNSNGLYQYQQTKLSFTSHIPNLYNSHKSKRLLDGPPIYKWRCQISQNSNLLYAAFDIDMIQRFQITQNNKSKTDISLQYIDTLPYPNDIKTSTSYIDTICIDKNEEYMYIPVVDQNNIILKYQIPSSSNLTAPLKFIQSLKYSNAQYAESLKISQDNRYLVLAYTVGILIVDIGNFEVISLLTIKDMQNNCYGADFTRDTNYIFATARNIGIWIIDARDKQNPFVIQAIKTKAAETVKSSKLYDIMYCIDGFNGLLIFDTSTLPNIKVLSHLTLQGWVNDITLLQNENFGIISTMDSGMLSLINLTNKTNPYVISSYQIGQQNSYSTCVDPNMQYVLILNSQSIRYFPINSDTYIHYEFSVKQTSQSSLARVILSEDDYLQVGQTYELRLMSLYQQLNQQINNIFIYQNEQKQALPTWINQINKLYLQMTIPKEAISISNNSIITLLAQTQYSLSNSSFIYNSTSFAISPNLSDKIYYYLKIIGFINSYDLVTDLFNPEVALNFNDFGSDLTDPNQQRLALNFISSLLQNSIDYNPIYFKVQSSLSYILNQKNNSFQVYSISNTVSFQLSFNSSSSLMFVQKQYPNVIAYCDDQNTTLNLQSSVDSINNVLRENILYHIIENQNNQNKQLQVNLLIQDNINTNIKAQFNLSDLTFLKLKQKIKQQKELQPQIERVSSDSSFAIESTFIIEFDYSSFIDPDGIPLSYQLQIYQNNNYENILSEYFIKFDEQYLRIIGTPQASNLFETIYLRLVISNGYNQLYSGFYLKINKISLIYILNIILKYIGIVAFIVGIFRYKSWFVNILYRDKTFYSQEIAQINKVYRKKITLIENELIVAQSFFKKFQTKQAQNKKMRTLGKDNIKNQIDQVQFVQEGQEKCNNRPSISNIISSFNTQVYQNSIKIKSYATPFSDNNLIQNQIPNVLCEAEKKRAQLVKNSLLNSKTNSVVFNQDLIFMLCYSHPQVVNNLLTQTELNQNLQYYNQNKHINIKISADKLFSIMIQNNLNIQFQGNNLKISDFSKEYQNIHSRFNYCLNANVVDYLLQLDTRTNIVYSYLKEYSQRQMKFKQNDWYKAFVQIEPTKELDCYGIIVPFSNITVNQSSIVHCLYHLDLYHSTDQPLDEIWQYGISPILLKQALIFESLGLMHNSQSKMSNSKSKGESIFVKQYEIFSVEAFTFKKQTKLNFIQKCLNLQYKKLPIFKYQYLPNWIQLNCKKGLIMLEGIPTSSDHDEILIRIYNVSNYIMMQYILKIDQQSQSQIIQQNFPQQFNSNQQETLIETHINQAKFSQPTIADFHMYNDKKIHMTTKENAQNRQIIQLEQQNNINNQLSQNKIIFSDPVSPNGQQNNEQPDQDTYLRNLQIKPDKQQSNQNNSIEKNLLIQSNNKIKSTEKRQKQKNNQSSLKFEQNNCIIQTSDYQFESQDAEQIIQKSSFSEKKMDIELNNTKSNPNPFQIFQKSQ